MPVRFTVDNGYVVPLDVDSFRKHAPHLTRHERLIILATVADALGIDSVDRKFNAEFRIIFPIIRDRLRHLRNSTPAG